LRVRRARFAPAAAATWLVVSMSTTDGAICFTTAARHGSLAAAARTGIGTAAPASDAMGTRPSEIAARTHLAIPHLAIMARQPRVMNPCLLSTAAISRCAVPEEPEQTPFREHVDIAAAPYERSSRKRTPERRAVLRHQRPKMTYDKRRTRGKTNAI
jgi:hypothetical protein